MAVEMKLELVAVPVSDIDRAKDFYVSKVGFNADHDHQFNKEIRFVQLTPPGSGCSIAMATGPHAAQMEPGSIDGLCLVVEDANAIHDQLAERGVEVSEVQDMPWGRFVFFRDPDGNKWSVQQVQYPGRPIP
jgi:catechol 2,3-dioxygenase-like lactoylglutathione lyase family enzyme